MNEYNLRNALKELKDARRGQGRMHQIDVVLMITIMATMSGFMGYRGIGDFAIRYKKELVEYLKIEKDRVPTFCTIRNVMMKIDHEEFGKIFTEWMSHYLKKDDEKWVSIDGKAIKGTKQTLEDKKLAHMVTFFKSDSKEILQAKKTATKSNEIPLVQEMLKEFPLKNMILTLDALHCQVETVKAIKNSGNEFVVQVKNNQKNS